MHTFFLSSFHPYYFVLQCLKGSVGYDKQLGLCKCKVDDLEDVCDRECRNKQRNRVTIVCSDPALIRVRAPDGSIVVSSKDFTFRGTLQKTWTTTSIG